MHIVLFYLIFFFCKIQLFALEVRTSYYFGTLIWYTMLRYVKFYEQIEDSLKSTVSIRKAVLNASVRCSRI